MVGKNATMGMQKIEYMRQVLQGNLGSIFDATLALQADPTMLHVINLAMRAVRAHIFLKRAYVNRKLHHLPEAHEWISSGQLLWFTLVFLGPLCPAWHSAVRHGWTTGQLSNKAAGMD